MMKQAAALAVSLAALLCACAKPPLEVPQYPLDIPTVEAALEEAGFSWTITQGQMPWVEQTVYQFHNGDGKLISFLGSVGMDQRRFLQLEFFAEEENITTVLPEEDWEAAIRLATRLFGGFPDDGWVWESLKDTHEEKTEALVDPENLKFNRPEAEVFIWRNEVDGIQCMVRFRRWTDWGAEEPHTVLQSIWFTSPPDAFETQWNPTPKSGSAQGEGSVPP